MSAVHIRTMAAKSVNSTKLAPTFKFDSAHHILPDATRRILNEIEQQFYLSDDKLLAITGQFLEDFSLGLGEYGKPMAMMYVGTNSFSREANLNCDGGHGTKFTLPQPDIRHWRPRWHRERVRHSITLIYCATVHSSNKICTAVT